MQTYHINYFGEEYINYFGDLDGAIKYAESFARNLILTYRGAITITNDYGIVVASQQFVEADDGTSSPNEWER